jgi:hypothetical protein
VHRLLPGVYLLDAAFLCGTGKTVLGLAFTLLGILPAVTRLWRRRKRSPS